MVYSIDPGTYESAIVAFDGRKIHFAQIMTNDALIKLLRNSKHIAGKLTAIEGIASYGMAVGADVFLTCEWSGRFREAAENNGGIVQKVYRKDVKINLCGSMKATDANISQALRDKYGERGTKNNPGPLYSITSHLWAALAVADYALTYR